MADEVRRAAAAPLHACSLQDGLFETGLGIVIVIRKTGVHSYALGGFLVDVNCLGVKDAMFRELDEEELEMVLDGIEATAPLASVDPYYARKLLRDAAAYARSLGLPPHADYAAVERLFGDVDADGCDVQFQFGYEGRPLYVPGPTESATQVRRRVDLLRRKLGVDGFDFGLPGALTDALDETSDEDDDVQGAYDPALAPDPAEWLALDEEERIGLAEDFHRRAGDSLNNATAHAALHAVVETQIARGDPAPVGRAMERLLAEGIGRHEAVHALGAAFAAHVLNATDDPEAKPFPAEAYSAAVERLTSEGWRRQWEDARN